ncbi:uncharacterized protein DUF4232 [Saccharothrix saharensis]|uniref:Uncharacterized protein DUF4232 n=1 Tax=Saccharothrix saharensis TaxID=571190 RepID=A0A543JEX8_9PSEU|nr:DUF4232 domain-containing protein [Saccharothrix saharensis]TQM81397.1 uncharacterized protein DUF4232 [Saccharothrix saharensis]
MTRRFLATVAISAAVLAAGGTAVARAESTTCGSVDLDIAFGRAGGAAGTTYREVVLTNRGLRTCVLRGFPGVSYVDANGDRVGAAAVRVGERGAPLTLPHGAAATSDVGFAQVDNFDPDACRKTPVWGVRVFPPGETAPLYLRMTDQHGCAGDVSAFGNHLTAASVRS